MTFKRLCVLVVAGAMLIGGCVFDDSDDKDSDKATSISDLTTGGYVFIIGGMGYGLAQIVTLQEDNTFEDAVVYVNGIQLGNSMGVHTNTDPLPIGMLTSTGNVRIAVYALGDSFVTTIPIPETPVIDEPAENTALSAGENMPFRIGFPGVHEYIAFSILGQSVTYGLETDKTLLEGEIPGTSLPNSGTYQLTAYSANMSGDIPDNFDLTNPQKIFVAASVAYRNLTFGEKR